jgi:hypothetical protein
MNVSGIEPPPPKGMGCFGKGCLILISFFVLLGLAFIGGTFLAVHALRTSYFAMAPVPLPAAVSTEQEQQMARAKWAEFNRAAQARTGARIELSADELNALIASEPKLRGKGFVTIENDTARLQVSFTLSHLKLLRDRYMNAECSVQAAPDGDPTQVRVSGIIVNGKAVPDDVLSWRGPGGFRRYIEQWTDRSNLKTFEIRDGKVILETKGTNE